MRPARKGAGIPTRPESSGLRFHCASGLNRDPLTRTHVVLLGPCFKTGQVGDRSTRRQPSRTPAGLAQPTGTRRRLATESVCAPAPHRTPVALLHPPPEEETTKPNEASLLPRSADVPCDEKANNRRPRQAQPPATCRLSPLRPSPNRLRRPSGGKQMRRLAPNRRAGTAPSRVPSLPLFRRASRTLRLNTPATGFRGPTCLPLSSFTYS